MADVSRGAHPAARAVAFPPPRNGVLSDDARVLRLLNIFGFLDFCLAWHLQVATGGRWEREEEEERGIGSWNPLEFRHYIMPCSALRSWKPLGDIPKGGGGKDSWRELFFKSVFHKCWVFFVELCSFSY